MTRQHPITPPPELVQQWANDSVPYRANATGKDWEIAFAMRAAQWGADQELDACCEWVSKYLPYLGDFPMPEDKLRAARRPKPPSLKEQALEALASAPGPDYPSVMTVLDAGKHALIRYALEQLDD